MSDIPKRYFLYAIAAGILLAICFTSVTFKPQPIQVQMNERLPIPKFTAAPVPTPIPTMQFRVIGGGGGGAGVHVDGTEYEYDTIGYYQIPVQNTTMYYQHQNFTGTDPYAPAPPPVVITTQPVVPTSSYPVINCVSNTGCVYGNGTAVQLTGVPDDYAAIVSLGIYFCVMLMLFIMLAEVSPYMALILSVLITWLWVMLF